MPSNADDASPGNGNNITIEHTLSQTGGGNTSRAAPSLLGALMTPTGMAAGAFALLMTGGFGYFFNEWFEIPGLEDQVDDLEKEVDRLELEVERLTDANDAFETLNDRLNSSVLELTRQTQLLNASLDTFEDLNQELNVSNQELNRLNGELRFENDRFNASNLFLNETIALLNGQVDNFTIQIDELEDEARELNSTIQNLTDIRDDLQQTNSDLAANVEALNGNITDLDNEIGDLQSFNSDLLDAISYLDETAEGITSLRTLINDLTTTLEGNQEALIRRVELSYSDAVLGWDCGLRDTFRTQPFGGDFDTPIGSTGYPLVINYVNSNLASVLCLNIPDLERYIDTELVKEGALPPIGATITEMDVGTTNYANMAIQYYFPTNGRAGLTSEDWIEAVYDCANLAEDKQFRVFSA